MSDHCCKHDLKKPKPFYKTLLFWTFFLSALLYGISFIFPAFGSFRREFSMYLSMMFWPVALGFIAGGLMDHYVPQEYVSKFLAQHRKRTIFYAAGLGFLMSACSHGILALSMELHKKGASGPAVITFLLASPWANLPVTFLLFGFFGVKAFVIIFSALIIAVITGLIFQQLDRKGWIEKNRHTMHASPGFSIRKDVARRIKDYRFTFEAVKKDAKGIASGIWGLMDMVLGWVLIGALLASLMSAFVPEEIFHQWLGPSLKGLLVTLGFATIIEVCSEGTAPIAFEIYRISKAFGNSFAFMMAGVVTDYTEIGLIWSNIGRKTALWMVAVTLPQVIVLAWVFNHIF